MDKFHELQKLLDKVEIIDDKYKVLREADAFNIFTILRNAHDEVNLHSQFIGHLLNPNGSHKKKDEFLDAFLKICGIKDFNTENIEISKEEGKIDLLIKNDSQAIIIENKIYADDQPEQLLKYYKKIPNTVKVIYLILDGSEPSNNSLGNINKDLLICLSYKNDILDWISECIKIASLNPTLRGTLLQYKKLIGELTGNTMNEKGKKDILELLTLNNNILSAQKIVETWNYIKIETALSLRNETEEIIEKEFKILEYQKFSKSSLKSSIESKKNIY